MSSADHLASRAYEAFRLSVNNPKLPTWEKLPEAHRKGWRAATTTIGREGLGAAVGAISDSVNELVKEMEAA